MTTTAQHKRFYAAAVVLREAMPSGMTLAQLRRKLDVPSGTFRNYVDGWSAPRLDDPVWDRVQDAIGGDGMQRYRRAVSAARGLREVDPAARIDRLARRGRVDEAVALLESLRAEGLDLNADSYMAVAIDLVPTDPERSLYYALTALPQLHSERTGDIRVEDYACLLASVERYHEEIGLCEAFLAKQPHSGRIWRRKGIAEWYDNRLTAAFGSLSASLAHGVPRPRVVHARGQVLAEMGDYDGAITELTEALEAPLTPKSAAYARSTRAYAMFMQGDQNGAISEFAAAEAVTPDNGWLHWFRARAHESIGNHPAAERGLARALECRVPALNRTKRAYALQVLNGKMK